MRDKILEAMRQRDCILGVTPDHGGMWLSSLRNDGNSPWPSDVPRNFAEEEKSFYDYQAILSEQLDPTHDYSFFMDTEIVSDKSDCPMFYIGGADGVFGLYCYSNNTIRFTTNLLRSATNPNDKYANMIVYQGDARPAGRHSFEGRIEGNIIKTFFDNQQAFTSAVAARTYTKTVGCNRCSSGYVYNIRIVDLTENRVIWSYPSEAERVQLLTKTNVRTDRGVFEAADTSKAATIATQLTGTPETFLVFGDDGGLLEGAPLPGGVFTIPAGTKIRALIGFDRALTASEIAALI